MKMSLKVCLSLCSAAVLLAVQQISLLLVTSKEQWLGMGAVLAPLAILPMEKATEGLHPTAWAMVVLFLVAAYLIGRHGEREAKLARFSLAWIWILSLKGSLLSLGAVGVGAISGLAVFGFALLLFLPNVGWLVASYLLLREVGNARYHPVVDADDESELPEHPPVGRSLRFVNLVADLALIGIVAELDCVLDGMRHLDFDEDFLLKSALFVATGLVYYVLSEFVWGATPGKMLTECIVVERDTSSKVGFPRVLGRTLLRLVPFDCLTFLPSPEGLHDRVSVTRTIQAATAGRGGSRYFVVIPIVALSIPAVNAVNGFIEQRKADIEERDSMFRRAETLRQEIPGVRRGSILQLAEKSEDPESDRTFLMVDSLTEISIHGLVFTVDAGSGTSSKSLGRKFLAQRSKAKGIWIDRQLLQGGMIHTPGAEFQAETEGAELFQDSRRFYLEEITEPNRISMSTAEINKGKDGKQRLTLRAGGVPLVVNSLRVVGANLDWGKQFPLELCFGSDDDDCEAELELPRGWKLGNGEVVHAEVMSPLTHSVFQFKFQPGVETDGWVWRERD